jgi:hypothetical protein
MKLGPAPAHERKQALERRDPVANRTLSARRHCHRAGAVGRRGDPRALRLIGAAGLRQLGEVLLGRRVELAGDVGRAKAQLRGRQLGVGGGVRDRIGRTDWVSAADQVGASDGAGAVG